jgi:hypothetical protein
MNRKLIGQIVVSVLSVFAGVALLAAGYFVGMHRAATTRPMPAMAATAASGDKIDSQAGRKVLYWHDPMVPNQHFDKPGKSPFMDMQLQPVYADDGGGSTGIRISPGLQQDLGIRYATVHRRETSEGFDAIGTTQFDESQADVVQSRVNGYIDHLYASAPMQRIAKGVRARLACAAGGISVAQARRHGRCIAAGIARAHACDVDSRRCDREPRSDGPRADAYRAVVAGKRRRQRTERARRRDGDAGSNARESSGPVEAVADR